MGGPYFAQAGRPRAGGLLAVQVRLQPVILLLHHRYRHAGGEERAVEDLAWLIREHLGEDVEVLERDSTRVGPRPRRRAGCSPAACARTRSPHAVRRTGARVVHAHNVHPTFGWRALAGGREAGARVVLHLHNYRLVCAVGTCFTHGEDCTRCHGRNTLPGVRLNCRGVAGRVRGLRRRRSRCQQRRLTGAADAIVVPSAFALAAPRAPRARRSATTRACSARSSATFATRLDAASGEFVLAAGPPHAREGLRRRDRRVRARRAPARGRRRRAAARRARGAAGHARFVGHVSRRSSSPPASRSRRRRRPSRYAEILPLAALEAMAAGAADGRRALRAGWPRRCRRRACTRPATSARSPHGSKPSGATQHAGERALAAARAPQRARSDRRADCATIYGAATSDDRGG